MRLFEKETLVQDFINRFVGKRRFEKVSFSNGRSCQSWIRSHDESLKTQPDPAGIRHQLQPNPSGRCCLFSQWTERKRCSSVSEGETLFPFFPLHKVVTNDFHNHVPMCYYVN